MIVLIEAVLPACSRLVGLNDAHNSHVQGLIRFLSLLHWADRSVIVYRKSRAASHKHIQAVYRRDYTLTWWRLWGLRFSSPLLARRVYWYFALSSPRALVNLCHSCHNRASTRAQFAQCVRCARFCRALIACQGSRRLSTWHDWAYTSRTWLLTPSVFPWVQTLCRCDSRHHTTRSSPNPHIYTPDTHSTPPTTTSHSWPHKFTTRQRTSVIQTLCWCPAYFTHHITVFIVARSFASQ